MRLSPNETRITGKVIRVLFQNRANGWFVAEVRDHEFQQITKVVGTSLVSLESGYLVACTGMMKNGEHGPQFESSLVEASPPRTISGIRRYLSGGIFKGIGEKTTDLIVDFFGVHTIDILDQSPDDLKNVPKLTDSKRKLLVEQWQSHKDLRDITLFALSQGITLKQIKKIIKQYGDNAIAIIKADPYCLYRDIDGIGFRTADAIARKLGVGLDSPLRIRAALRFTLEQASTEGHCGLFRPIAVSKCIEILRVDLPDGEKHTITTQAVVDAGRIAITDQEIVLDTLNNQQAIYLPWLHSAESGIAHHIARLLNAPARDPLVEGQLLGLVERVSAQCNIQLGAQQLAAVKMALTHKVCIITGGPGVGKTTIQKVLLAAFDERGWSCCLCAPTGKAANRMSENANRPAKTIHRLLGYRNGAFQHNEEYPIETSVVIADEFSMVDVLLANSLLQAIRTDGRLIIVGDAVRSDEEDDLENEIVPLLDVQFSQGLVSLTSESAANLHHAYAITIHKSQGSEFDVLVLVVCRSHYIMLKRNLVYTGITRGKKEVVIVGQNSALKIAAKNVTSSDRHTRLYALLNSNE